ncbi:hypothetical protein [Roseococcus pinisoli]|uniref:Transcriptional regulator n=1 Tax=Roseococcus pinisoli TaxID=2835040 RepID=A0ABS5QBB8_9PROT|nr:hypothetical protein [Roseococcus pinisoli]MBS7810536.1 hypothetical protein [Roseococcus pinisoli]
MPVTVIRNDRDLKQALFELQCFIDNPPAPGTPGADAFNALWNLIAAYEDKHWPDGPKLAD